MMKTIRSIIGDELLSRASVRSIRRDELIEETYYRFPRLEQIDNELIALRGSRMLTAFEDNDVPVKVIEVREKELRHEREEFIRKNNIDPDFDEEKPLCAKCLDKGFISAANGQSVVCGACMKEELEECFRESGMEDYSTYKLKSFDAGYFDNKKERQQRFIALKSLFEGPLTGSPLRIYSDKPQSGKTFMSVIITKYAIVEGKSAYYLKAEDLRQNDQEFINELKKYDLLIIDDYSADLTRNWIIASSLNSVLEARQASNRPVVIVSLSSREQLIADSDERIALKLKRAENI